MAPVLGITSRLTGTKELPIPHPGPGHGGPRRSLLLLPQVTITHSPKTSLLPQHVPLNPPPLPHPGNSALPSRLGSGTEIP